MPLSDGDDAYRIEDVGRVPSPDRALAAEREALAWLAALHPPQSYPGSKTVEHTITLAEKG